MKTRITFQTLILGTVVPVLVVLTALWGVQVYRTTQRIILAGFDGKLRAIADGTAVLTDGDGHAQYQRRRTLVGMAPAAANHFVAIDPGGDQLVEVQAQTGSARRIASLPPEGLRALAAGGTPRKILALTSDGTELIQYGDDGVILGRVTVAPRLDGVFMAGEDCWGWTDRQMYHVDPTSGTLVPHARELPTSVLSVTVEPASNRRWALTMDRYDLIEFTPENLLVRRIRLRRPADQTADASASADLVLHAIAFLDGRLFAVGGALHRVDSQTGIADATGFPSGYFNVDDPFYHRYRGVYTYLQDRAALSYLYTQVYVGENAIYYILDGTVGAGYSPPGTADILPPASVDGTERVQYAGHSWVSPIEQWQAWGLLKSGISPIRNSVGHVVAMSGADIDIGIIRQKTRWALFGAILVGVGAFVAAGFISLRVGATLTRPVQHLKEAALRIAAGSDAPRIQGNRGREITALAAELDALRARVERERRAAREWQDTLREQRETTALARALSELSTRLGGFGENGRSVEGCHASGTTVWWFTAAESDPVTVSYRRARIVVLVRELIRSGLTGHEVTDAIVAAYPLLVGVACWHGWTETLHYRTSRPVRLQLGAGYQTLSGTGSVPCETLDDVVWQVTPTEAAGMELSGRPATLPALNPTESADGRGNDRPLRGGSPP